MESCDVAIGLDGECLCERVGRGDGYIATVAEYERGPPGRPQPQLPWRQTRSWGIEISAVWRGWSGYHRRRRVETGMHCVELPGQRLTARGFERQVGNFQIRVAVLNRYAAPGIILMEAVA